MKTSDELMSFKFRRRAEEDRLGADIIDECRVQLMMKFRFLDLALWRMELSPMRVDSRYPLATDGKKVHFDSLRVIGRFQGSFEESVRDYLHLIMHCIFRHPYNEEHGNKEAWSLACDIVVENAAMDICGSRFESPDDKARRQALSEIRLIAGSLLPNKVYHVVKGLIQTPEGQHFHGMGKSNLNEWRALFERDDHGAWPVNNDGGGTFHDPDATEEVSEDNDQPDFQPDSIQTNSPDNDEAQGGGDEQEQEMQDAPEPTDDETAPEEQSSEGEAEQDVDTTEDSTDEEDSDEKDWEEIAKQIEMSLETFAREWGEEAGSLMESLAFANRKRYNYDDFLRKFMTITEQMQLNMDEFDYVYYTFGLEVYGNMPLIEPLEYKETETIREFVIAIDTSESVSGDLVKSFVEHTFSILKSSEDRLREVNIHVIQCDTKVQSDVRIREASDVERMMESFQVRGFGGTDFRPVFDYVEMLRRRGELQDLKGLIYFTDGLGQFPEKTPDYDVAFVFVDDEGAPLPPVPPWAMKIVLTTDEVEKAAGL